MKKEPTIERFWRKVIIQDNGCWLWSGSLSSNGYGLIWHNGHNIRAHRFAYEYITHSVIPGDKELDHLCRNHQCVNPHHLEIVTRRENVMRGDNPKILRQRMLNTDRAYFQRIGRIGGLNGKAKPKTFKGRSQATRCV